MRCCLVAMLVLSAQALAAQESVRTHPNDRPECRINPADPFEPAAVAIGGRDKGMCLDAAFYRHLVKLQPDEAAAYGLEADPEHLVVANVRDYEGFFVARIPLAKVSHSFLLIEKYLGGLPDPGHAAIRMFFSEPVPLVSQTGDGNARTVTSLIFSVNANQRYWGQPGFAVRMFDQSFALAMGAFTPRAFVGMSVITLKNPIEQWRMSLAGAQAAGFVQTYADHSDRYGFAKPFHITQHNCIQELIAVFDDVLEYTPEQTRRIASVDARLGTLIPVKARFALAARGLMEAEGTRLEDFAEDPTVAPLISELGETP